MDADARPAPRVSGIPARNRSDASRAGSATYRAVVHYHRRMRRFFWLVGTLALIGGCKDTRVEPPYDGPMPVTFGDCAGPKTAWLSGPKPAPFSPGEAQDVGT